MGDSNSSLKSTGSISDPNRMPPQKGTQDSTAWFLAAQTYLQTLDERITVTSTGTDRWVYSNIPEKYMSDLTFPVVGTLTGTAPIGLVRVLVKTPSISSNYFEVHGLYSTLSTRFTRANYAAYGAGEATFKPFREKIKGYTIPELTDIKASVGLNPDTKGHQKIYSLEFVAGQWFGFHIFKNDLLKND
jgi:hypothetical protein